MLFPSDFPRNRLLPPHSCLFEGSAAARPDPTAGEEPGTFPSAVVGREERCERPLYSTPVNNALVCTYGSLKTQHAGSRRCRGCGTRCCSLRGASRRQKRSISPLPWAPSSRKLCFLLLISSFLFNELVSTRDDACLGAPCALARDDPIRSRAARPARCIPSYPGL